MARIRSIKPDIWTDEKFVELSPLARLLFIGLWNFADDYGRMAYSPVKIKLQVLPADSADVSALLGEIRGKNLITVYQVDGKEYLQINGWEDHQKIDKRSASKHPEFRNVPPTPAESSREIALEGRGGEGNGGEGKGSTPANAGVAKPAVPPCPHQQIIELYHDLLPTAQRVNPELWNGTRATHLQARWRENPKRQTLDFWRRFFGYIAESDFLCGRTTPAPGKTPFVLTLGWIVKADNFTKIHEGNYHRGRE